MPHVWVKTVTDWAANEDTACVMPAEVSQTAGEFRIRVAMPGCDEKHVRVTVSPHIVAVEGSITQPDRPGSEDVLLSEFTGRRLFRKFDLPEEIAPDEVRAHLRNGMLTVIAEKASAAKYFRPCAAARA
jgi:HSP20 family molecular chaperone IbpA